MVLLLAGLSSVTSAQVRPDRPRMNPRMGQMDGRGMALHMQIPDLTDQQKEQIQSIALNNHEAMIPLRNQMQEKRARLRTLSTGNTIDQEAADKVIEEIGSLRVAMMKHRFDTRMKIRTLLNEEQKVWLDTHHAMFGGKRFNRKSR